MDYKTKESGGIIHEVSDSHHKVDIFEIHEWKNSDNKIKKDIEYGVNWSGIGTMSAEQTKEYAELLNKAAGIAKAMTDKAAAAKKAKNWSK